MFDPSDKTVPAVSLSGIVKEFRGNRVLHGVDFDLKDGEVHALVGSNGSGKSTLMKIVYGLHRPSEGTMKVRGEPVRLRNPGHAFRYGIATVPQELPLVGGLSVAENIFFGNLPRRTGVVAWRELRQRAQEVLARVDTEGCIDPLQPVNTLDLGAQQLVSIARALGQGADILVFDEPTSSLNAEAAQRLFTVISSLRSEGRAIAFISQRLDDIFAVADQVSVLRDGIVVGKFPVGEVTTDTIAELMVGHAPTSAVGSRSVSKQRSVLEVAHLSVGRHLHDLTFSLLEGEVLGLVGLPGSGAEDILPALFGRKHITGGSVRLFDRDTTRVPLRSRVQAGMAYVSGDRSKEGLVRAQTVEFNLTLALNNRCQLVPLSRSNQRQRVNQIIEKLWLRPSDPNAIVATLSGGNQQKVVVGRWLLANSRLWLLNDPTRGVDIHARHDIHTLIREQVAESGGAIMTSSDIREMLEVCDRLLVLYRGKVVAELDAAQSTEHRVLALASGNVENNSDSLLTDRRPKSTHAAQAWSTIAEPTHFTPSINESRES